MNLSEHRSLSWVCDSDMSGKELSFWNELRTQVHDLYISSSVNTTTRMTLEVETKRINETKKNGDDGETYDLPWRSFTEEINLLLG